MLTVGYDMGLGFAVTVGNTIPFQRCHTSVVTFLAFDEVPELFWIQTEVFAHHVVEEGVIPFATLKLVKLFQLLVILPV